MRPLGWNVSPLFWFSWCKFTFGVNMARGDNNTKIMHMFVPVININTMMIYNGWITTTIQETCHLLKQTYMLTVTSEQTTQKCVTTCHLAYAGDIETALQHSYHFLNSRAVWTCTKIPSHKSDLN